MVEREREWIKLLLVIFGEKVAASHGLNKT